MISVPPSTGLHVRTPDDMYLRIADVDRLLTFAERTALLYERGEVAFEATPASRFGGAELNLEACSAFAGALGIAARSSCCARAASAGRTAINSSPPSCCSARIPDGPIRPRTSG